MSTQPEALLEAELVAQLRGMGFGVVAKAVAAGEKWKKGLFADVPMSHGV